MKRVSEEQVKEPVQVLTITRDIFRASHWITSNYTSSMHVEEPLTLEDGTTSNYKAVGCSIGGMRYAMLAPMDNALDEAWMYLNFQELGESGIGNRADVTDEIAESYLAATTALAREILGDEAVEEWLDDVDGDPQADIYTKIQWMEDAIVSWNDDQAYDHISDPDEREERRLRIVAEVIVPTFDRAIARLTREGVAA